VSRALLFRPLLPSTVLLAEMAPDQADPEQLHAAEFAQIAHAVERRRREYAAGRLLARELLRQCGAPPSPLLNGTDRAPQWPVGVVGSITHCTGFCAVAVTTDAATAAVGIDAEPAEPLPEGVAARVLGDAERRSLERLPAELQGCADRLVFSAKEAVFKALFPLIRAFLDFPEVEVVLETDGRFKALPLTLPAVGPVPGTYRMAGGYLAAAVVLPASYRTGPVDSY
jgi:4'-phosphopantetheinyl transferase EntD